MSISRSIGTISMSVLGLVTLGLPATAQQTTKIDLSDETVGAEPKSFLGVVGVWRVEQEGAKKVLAVDGRQ